MNYTITQLKKIINKIILEDLGKIRVPVSHSMGTSSAFFIHSGKESLGDTIDTSEVRELDTTPVEVSRIFKGKKAQG